MVVGERRRSRARERLEALADATLEPDEACLAAVEILREAIGFERWCWPRTDPGSALSTSGLADFDLWEEIPRIAALEEHGDVTSKPRLVLGARASISLHAATGGDLSRSTRWRECLRPYGVGDEAMTVCRDHLGCWGSVELMREETERPFDEQDIDFLHELAPTLGTLLRRSQQPSQRLGEAPALAPATLILDASLQPTSWTPVFRQWLAELSPDGVMLPPAVYELGARVRTPDELTNGLPALVRLTTRTGRCATLEGARLEGTSSGCVAITIRDASSTELLDLFCRTYNLTQRERQLIALVLDGLATKPIADKMFITPYTVQDHLKAIFAKTGLRSRREVVSHLVG
jgi:DNA-binding CsgD family transcriptional regulator